MQQIAGAVAGYAQSAQQGIKETVHSLKVGGQEVDWKDATHALKVQVLAAADLREDALAYLVGTCDAYAAVTLGQVDEAWPVKTAKFGQVGTRVIVGQRHPRWNLELMLPVKLLPAQPEASVRVFSSNAVGDDTTLGEVRMDLTSSKSGAACKRILGGGFASLVVRWALVPVAEKEADLEGIAAGSSDFKEALTFWAGVTSNWGPDWKKMFEAQANGDTGFSDVARQFQVKLRDAGGSLANELILQAPLTGVLGTDGNGAKELIAMLPKRLSVLQAPARARLAGVLVERLGSGLTSREGQELLVSLFTTLKGQALGQLKRLLNTAGIGLDMVILHKSITNKDLRGKLIVHFNQVADKQEAQQQCCCFGSLSAAVLPAPTTIILSDIDMTFWVGKFGTGGPKFPPGIIPGVRPLYKALGAQLTFLSARPALVESSTRRELMEAGAVDVGLLKGSLRAVLMAPVAAKQAHQAMGEKKQSAFLDFYTLHPEARFIFFGDTGEGDLDFATGQFAATGNNFALIHDVVAEDGITPRTGEERRAQLKEQNVVIFDSYAGAAVALYERGLLPAAGLRTATRVCREEFEAIPNEKFASPEIRAARQNELRAALDKAGDLLGRVGYSMDTP